MFLLDVFLGDGDKGGYVVQFWVQELFVNGLLSADMVVLEVGAIEVGLESGEPFSELDESGVNAEGVRSEFTAHPYRLVALLSGLVLVLDVCLRCGLDDLDCLAGS